MLQTEIHFRHEARHGQRPKGQQRAIGLHKYSCTISQDYRPQRSCALRPAEGQNVAGSAKSSVTKLGTTLT